MYKQMEIGGGRTMTVLSVAPPCDWRLDNEALAEMSVTHFLIDNPEKMAGFAEAIRNASDEDIERSRLQILHALKMIDEHIVEQARFHSWPHQEGALLADGETADGAVAKAAKYIATGAREFLKAADGSPKNKENLRRLAGAMAMLAEAKVYAAEAAAASPGDRKARKTAEEAAKEFDAIGKLADAFRAEVGPRYAHVKDLLPSSAALESKAEAAVRNQVGPLPDLSYNFVWRTETDCGSRDSLWGSIQSEKSMKEAVEKGWHRELSPTDIAALREKASRIIDDFNAVFNGDGFVTVLKQAALAIRYDAEKRITDSHYTGAASEIKETIERMRKAYRYTEAEAKQELARRLEELPKRQGQAQRKGHGDIAEANRLIAAMDKVTAHLRPDFEIAPVLTLTKDDTSGAVVGRLNADPERTLVIYDDHMVGYRGAVYATVLPAELVADGIPPLEAVRDKGWADAGDHCPSTNYHSLADAVSGLSSDTWQQEFFLGRTFRVDDRTAPERVRGF